MTLNAEIVENKSVLYVPRLGISNTGATSLSHGKLGRQNLRAQSSTFP